MGLDACLGDRVFVAGAASDAANLEEVVRARFLAGPWSVCDSSVWSWLRMVSKLCSSAATSVGAAVELLAPLREEEDEEEDDEEDCDALEAVLRVGVAFFFVEAEATGVVDSTFGGLGDAISA